MHITNLQESSNIAYFGGENDSRNAAQKYNRIEKQNGDQQQYNGNNEMMISWVGWDHWRGTAVDF